MPTSEKKNSYLVPFILVTTLFFLWAFLHNINPILIPHLKKACQLTNTQSAFIDTAVYLGYFTMAIPAGIFMKKYGYKKGILLGLILYAVGDLLFIPAAGSLSYALFLTALFITASGATFLETVANPYITKLGDPATSEQRLNFAQSFNGVGSVVAPLIGGSFILTGIEHSEAEIKAMDEATRQAYFLSEAATVKIPYLVIAIIVLIVAALFFVARIPEIKEGGDDAHDHSFSTRVLRHSHVKWAVIAQLFYVGAQVCVGSFFVRFAGEMMQMPEKKAAVVWGTIAMVGFMLGRFVGTFLMRYISAAKLLSLYAIINVLLLLAAMFSKGSVATYAVVTVPFFMSIMFPTIFALGIKDIGEETKSASSFIVMSIAGGAFFPLLMGLIADKTGTMQPAYIVPLLCFLVVLYYGWKGHQVKSVQS